MRRATCVTIHQSGLASPGAGRNARWREIRRSELVTVPSFSPQAAAGSRTCAPAATVSFAAGQAAFTLTLLILFNPKLAWLMLSENFSIMDLLFYALAVYAGYRTALKPAAAVAETAEP